MTPALAALTCAAVAGAQSTTLVSVSSSGAQGNQFSEAPAVSADGRYTAFQSIATTLVAGDTNNHDDIFVHDRISGTTTRVSVATGGAESNGYSALPSISADARYVAFESGASNLVTGDGNTAMDVFVHDRQTGATTRVSVASGGAEGNGPSYSPALSTDGRWVAFHSAANNLVAGDTNNAWDVFVHDRQTGATVRASVSSSGAQATGACSTPAISANGRYVVFQSVATNLVTGDTNGAWDIFVRDLTAGTTARVSVASSGTQGNGSCADASISDDGRYVVFTSAATNLIPSDSNAREDVFLRDLQLGTTLRVSVATGGGEGDDVSRKARISADGRFVAFESLAQNLVAADTNGEWDIFVHNRVSGATERADVDSSGNETDGTSSAASISSTGRFVAFQSYATNLVAGDTNNTGDVFLRDRGTEAPLAYCTAGTTSHGCVPVISGVGTPSAGAASGFTIAVSTLEGQRTGLIFFGNSGMSSWPWSSTSTSYMCVKSPTQRMPVQSSGGTNNACDGALARDFLAFMAANPAALGQPLVPGEMFFAQAWFRDPPASKSTNLSGGLMFTLVP